MSTKRRTLQFLRATNQQMGAFPGTPYEVSITGDQITDSTNNHWFSWQRLIQEDPSLRRHDIGSAFYTRKPIVEDRGAFFDVITRVTPTWPNGTYGFKGHTFPALISGRNEGHFASIEAQYIGSVDTGLLSAGATAISRVSPTVPASSVATALGELYKDGLPKLIGSSFSGRSRSGAPLAGAADEYLNYQFAIKPFLSDIKKIGKATSDASMLLAQLRRNSGRLVRRRYTFPVQKSTSGRSTSTTAYPHGLGNTYYWDQGGSLGTTVEEIKSREETWFSGAFTYHFGDTNDRMVGQIKAAEQQINKLYGSVSASTAWDLLPFSWAADWAFNLGDVIRNVDLFSRDGLVMHHGYVMRKYRIMHEVVTTGAKFSGRVRPANTQIGPLSLVYGVETKYRRQASPYGFGLSEAGFNSRQKSIVAALGLSRLRK